MAVLDTPFKASGTTLSSHALPTGSFVVIAFLIDLELGGITTAEIDTTVLTAVVKTNMPSIPASGDLTFSVFYVPGDTGVQSLITQATTPTIAVYQIQTPDGSSSTTGSSAVFNAWVSSFAPKGFAIDGSPTADVTLTITGAITFTPGT